MLSLIMWELILRGRVVVFSVVFVMGMVLSSPGHTQQQNTDPPRVALDFRCPTYVLPGNTPITMYAEVLGARQLLDQETASRIRFRWQLAGGNLHSGQGSGKIVFDSISSASNPITVVNVKLQIRSAPPELESEKSCTIKVDSGCIGTQLMDQYSGISLDEEQRRLDRIAEYLIRTGPESIAYIASYMGRRACIGESEWRAARAKKYLVEKQNISATRIVEVDGGVREHWSVEVFVQTQGTCGPIPTPTVARDDVLMQ